MSNNVDTRIVEMQFDNKDFEKNVQTSLNTLENLKKELDFDDSVDSLKSLEKVTKKISFDELSDDLKTITERFTTIGIAGKAVVENITNSLINLGKKILHDTSALFMEPMRTGMQEYETQMDSVQTILANAKDSLSELGYDGSQQLDLVCEKLDELNHYADKTIYNFTQMTQNIGRFTAAGVGLNESVMAIKGISNLAALSGSNAQQANSAMYNISQAISSGTMKVIDWNSVTNAGMGGKIFQDALVDAAMAMGVTVDVKQGTGKKAKTVKKTVKELIESGMSFRDTLSKGWLTDEVLLQTLEIFSWDFNEIAKNMEYSDEELSQMRKDLIKRGYTQEEIEELLAHANDGTVESAKNVKKAELLARGYTLEQADEYIELAERATEAATKVKTFTQLIDTLKEALQSGWATTWKLIFGDFEEAKELFTSISDYFGELVANSADSRNAIVQEWKNLGGRDSLIKSFWNIVETVRTVVEAIGKLFRSIIPKKTGKDFYDITKKIENFTEKIKVFVTNSERAEKIQSIFEGLISVFKIFANVIKKIGSLVSSFFSSFFSLFKKADEEVSSDEATKNGGILDFLANLGDKLTELSEKFKSFDLIGYIQNLWRTIKEKFLGLFTKSPKEKAISTVTESLEKARKTIKDTIINKFFPKESVFEKVKNWIVEIYNTAKEKFSALMSSEFMSSVFTTAGTVFQSVWGFLQTIPEKIKSVYEWFSKTFTSENISEAWTGIKNFFSSFAGGIGSTFSAIWDTVSGWLPSIKSGLKTAFEAVKTFFNDMSFSASDAATSIKDATSGGDSSGPSFFTVIVEKFGQLIDKIKSVNWNGVYEILKTIYKAYIGIQLVSGYANHGRGLKNIGKGLIGFGQGFQSIGTGFGGIAESIKSLGGILNPVRDGLTDVGGGLGGIGTALQDLVKNGIKIKKKSDTLGTTLLKIAGAVGILVASLYVLTKIKYEDGINGLKLMGIMAAGLLVFSLIISAVKFDGDPIMKLAISLILLLIPINKLAAMDMKTLGKGLLRLGLILLELAIFSKMSGKSVAGGNNKPGFINLAIGLLIMVSVLKKIAKMDTTSILKSVITLGIIFLELGLFMKSINKNQNQNGKNRGFIGIAIALLAMTVPLKAIAKMSISEILKGVIGLGIVMFEISLFMKSAGQQNDKVKGLLGMAIGLLAFTWALKSIGNMKTGKLIKGLIGIAAIVLLLKGLIKSLSKTDKKKNISMFTSLIVIAGIMAAFVAAFLILKNSNMNDVLKFAESISMLFLSLSISFRLISKIDGKSALKGLLGFTILLGGIGAITYGLGKLRKSMSSDAIDVMNSGTDFFEVIGRAIGRFVGGVKDGLATAKGTDELPTIGQRMTDFMNNSQGLFDGAKKIDESTVNGIKNLSKIMVDVGWAEIVQGVASWFSDDSPVETFAHDIVLLANGLNNFASIINGTKTLDSMGVIVDVGETTQSTNFGDSSTIGKLENAITIATKLTELITAIPWDNSDFMKKIEGYRDSAQFVTDVKNVGTALNEFGKSVNGIDTVLNDDSKKMAMDLAESLTALLPALPKDSDVNRFTEGTVDYDALKANLPKLGSALDEYAKTINGFHTKYKWGDISSAENALSGLIGLNNKIEESGGIYGWLMGEHDLSKLIANLPSLGLALKLYATFITGFTKTVTQEDVDNSTNAAEGLVKLENELTRDDGWIQKVIGNKDLEKFAAKMPGIATDLVKFATTLTQYKTEIESLDVTKIKAFMDPMIEMENSLIASNYDPGYKIKAFASNILTLTYSMESVAKILKSGELDFSGFSVITDFAKDVEKFNRNDDMTPIIDWTTLKNQNEKLIDFSEKMKEFGTNISNFADSISGVDEARKNLLSVGGMLDEFIALGEKYTDTSDPDWWKGNKTTYIDPAVNGYIETASTLLGETFGGNMLEGILGAQTNIEAGAEVLSVQGAIAAQGKYKNWFAAGENLVIGLSQGIANKAASVANEARRVAQAAINAITAPDAWDEHSPSRVANTLGMNFDLGLANGLTQYSNVVSSKSKEIGQSALESAKTMLTGVDTSIFDGIDPNPTIRPVIDLSNINSGIGLMNGMFQNSSTYASGLFNNMRVNRNMGMLNFDGAKILGSNNTSGIVAEIESLKGKFDELNNAISNMGIVLDTGTLVGATSVMMDNQLGTLAVRKGRGN